MSPKRIRKKGSAASELRETVRRLDRKSDEALRRYLAVEAVTLSRREGGARHKRIKIFKRAKRGKSATGIFVERENDWLPSTRPTIVQELRQALGNKPLPVDSDEVLETVWMTLRERICNDWRLCDKILSGDGRARKGALL
jgi:hypothetical protein